jgi:hypothetical protein
MLLLHASERLERDDGPLLNLFDRRATQGGTMMKTTRGRAMAAACAFALAACGGGGGGGGSNGGGGGSNTAEFVFDCDIGGVNAAMTMQVEAVSSSGAVWGSGPTPQITGVIGNGSFIYYTAGTLTSPAAQYSFRGENQYADFTMLNGNDRFRVEWIVTAPGLTIRVNPFGPGTTEYNCALRSSRRL